MKCKEILYKGKRFLEASDGKIEIYIALDFGMRISRLAFCGGQNFFCENMPDFADENKEKWKLYGGHRLWHTPEDKARTYEPDNFPVKYEMNGNVITVTQNQEKNGIIKMVRIRFAGNNSISVEHELKNGGQWEIETAAWCLSVMAGGGLAIVPQNGEDTGLLGNRVLGIWPYTKLTDKRFYLGDEFISVKSETGSVPPFKIGTNNTHGYVGYILNNQLFVKKFDYDKNELYPDFNNNFELYTNNFMIELESLSPITLLDKGESIIHTEEWFLFDKTSLPGSRDEGAFKKLFSELKVTNNK